MYRYKNCCDTNPYEKNMPCYFARQQLGRARLPVAPYVCTLATGRFFSSLLACTASLRSPFLSSDPSSPPSQHHRRVSGATSSECAKVSRELVVHSGEIWELGYDPYLERKNSRWGSVYI